MQKTILLAAVVCARVTCAADVARLVAVTPAAERGGGGTRPPGTQSGRDEAHGNTQRVEAGWHCRGRQAPLHCYAPQWRGFRQARVPREQERNLRNRSHGERKQRFALGSATCHP